MHTPSSFCSIATYNCHFELIGLLLSLSIYHPNGTIYLMVDTKTKNAIDNLTPRPKLNMFFFIELNEYDGMNRAMMERAGIFGKFLINKMKIMKYALKECKDTMFLDSDIIITSKIDDIDNEKNVGLSPQYIKKEFIDKTGYYNAGLIWTNLISVCDDWINIIDHNNHCPEQVNMVKLEKYSFFKFNENYNLQPWRMLLSDESQEKIKSYISSNIEDGILYKNKPLKFIHTHFHDNRFHDFNKTIINHLVKIKHYKLLLIIYRVINRCWLLTIPKQPLTGYGFHKNDSYRELPLLMKLNNKDVDIKYSANTMHCWISPNILTYDRPTLQWVNNEILNASLLLLGNGDINNEGQILKNKIPNINVLPWIFWPRRPILLEKILKSKGILSYEDRTIESIFIGNYENNVQEKYRNTNTNWENVLTEYHCTKGEKHLFSNEEYLHKLRESKYGLCLRGYGSKCHREVELMAFGTVPIVTENVSVYSYLEPLIENTHFIKVANPNELQEKIKTISIDKWKEMSDACYKWYQTNVDSKNCWDTMIERILYTN